MKAFEEVAYTKIPTANYKELMIRGFKLDGDTAIVIYKGNIFKSKNPIVRIHSQCLLGEVLASLRCDCHEQFCKTLNIISKNPPGLIIYLFQEGRSAGLVNKLKANHLEDEGMDTVEAYKALHLPIDQREYSFAVRILQYFGISYIRLLTNNPLKLNYLKENGIIVTERIPLEIKPNKYNRTYLKTKKNKMGHFLKL